MKKIAIYGKGGIGKSTIASNLSVALSERGYRVLHIGCDPKHDSCSKILNRFNVPTVLDCLDDNGEIAGNEFINEGYNGVTCVESGGPKAGEGCAGRGITKTFEVLSSLNIINEQKYDVVIYDVLGDVVCGGFATPLRNAYGDMVIIVVSAELMSLYAANNICHAIEKYQDNGIFLAGLVINKIDAQSNQAILNKFIKKLNAKILAKIPFSPDLVDSEKNNMTVFQYDRDAGLTKTFLELAETIIKQDKKGSPALNILSDAEFNDLIISK